MSNTKHAKVEFGQVARSNLKKEVQQSTYGIRQGKVEIIKMIQKSTDEDAFSGYKKVNYADQKVKEAYRKINKMLGGN